jgi:hypothetical protein
MLKQHKMVTEVLKEDIADMCVPSIPALCIFHARMVLTIFVCLPTVRVLCV